MLNLPNQITVARLLLSLLLFVLIPLDQFAASAVVFLIAAGTDWLDGMLARRWGQVTQLGRILDPFVDKFLICGTFIYLAAESPASRFAPWMAVTVVARELAVTVIRGLFEAEGVDFSANLSGKLKMVLQCIAATVCLLHLALWQRGDESLAIVAQVSVWLAVVATIYSGLVYIARAPQLLQENQG